MLHYRTYRCAPDRDWVVFVHGAGGSSSIWFAQLRDFSKHFNVLLVDLRGHGQSQGEAKARARYTFEEVSRDVLEVMDDAGVARAHFVGISLGSILIRTIGELAPERVQSLVMGGAVTRLTTRSRVLVGLGSLFKRVMPYLWLYKLFAWIIMPRRRHRTSRMLFINEARKLCQKEFLRWFRLTQHVNRVLRLFEEKALAIPTLYLMGAEDHLFLPPVQALVARPDRGSLQVIPEAGHVCNVDQPGLFNRYALAFLKAHAGAANRQPGRALFV